MLPSFLTAGLWAFSVIAANRSARLVGSAAANLSRLALAAILLAIWAHTFGTGLRGAALGWFVFSGIIGFGVGDIAGFESMMLLGPRLTVLLGTCVSAPIAIVIEWAWLGTRLTSWQLGFGFVILAGVAVALAPRDHLHLSRRQWLIGGLFGLLAAFGQGYGAVLSRKAFDVTKAAGETIDGGTATYQRAIGGLTLVLLFHVITILRRHLAKTVRTDNWRGAWPWVVGHALTGPTLGVSCFQWALATTPSGIVLPIVALTPLAVIPLAYLIDGDRPSRRSLIGGVIAVAGAVGLTIVK